MIANRVVVGGLALLTLAAGVDAMRGGGEKAPAPQTVEPGRRPALRIDLASSRDVAPVPRAQIERRFAGVVSKVAVRRDVAAVAVSDVPGTHRPRAAIQIWRDGTHVRTFRVRPGSFSRGMWFTDGGTIATIGWNGRGYLYDVHGRPLRDQPYFAYVTR